MKKIVVAGGGVLGSQIAFQAAYCGCNVTVWLRSEGSIGRTKPKLETLRQTYLETIEAMADPEGKTPQVWACGIADAESFDPEAFDAVMKFAAQIRMLALPVRKEKSGYLLNSMLVPMLFSAMDLYVNGVSDPQSIDLAWTRGTGAPKGPFRILDTVGLTTAHNIVKQYLKVPPFLAPYNFRGMDAMLQKYLDEGKLGMSSGEGFYRYHG